MKKENIKILFIAPSLKLGGGEKHLVVLADQLRERGHNVSVYSGPGIFKRELDAVGVNHIESPDWHWSLAGIRRQSRNFREIVRKLHPEIVHSYGLLPSLNAYLACRRLAGHERPFLVTTIHVLVKFRPYSYLIAAPALRFSTHLLLTVADSEKRRFVCCGFPEKKVRTIYNCVETEIDDYSSEREIIRSEMGAGADDFLIGIVARLHAVKGHRFFLRSMEKLAAEFPRVRAVFVGAGTEENALKEQVIAGKLEDRVVFMGFRSDVPRLMTAFDLVVLSSVREVFPISLVEAGAAGKAAVASRVGGVPELIEEGRNGLMVPPRDAEALAAKIGSLINDPEKLTRMGKEAGLIVKKKFTLKTMIDRIESCYRELLEGRA